MPKMTEEEFNNLPEKEQKRILQERKERENQLREKANTDLDEITANTLSEKQFNGKFTRTKAAIIESLRVLEAKKKLGELTGEDLYNSMVNKITVLLTN